MPKTKISEFSATPGNNTDIDGINIAEGCAPSGINDAIRELMAQLKDFQTGSAGDSFNGPIGSVTPAAGVFTNLSASGTFALTGDQVQISEGGTGQTTANAAFNALAPSQTSQSGKYLKTDGTNASWDALDISTADITGTLPIANGGTGLTALGTGVQTALGVNTGSAGAFVVNGGALGTPSSGTVTNLTGTASININGTVGATTPTTGAFTTVSASGNITVSGGTANGVAYLDESKVLTTGNVLRFDGTNLSIGALLPSAQFSQYSPSSVSREIYTFSITNKEDVGSNLVIYGPTSNHPLAFRTNNAERLRIDSSGNLGLGVTPSAWFTSSGVKTLQVGGSSLLGQTIAGSTWLSNNAYFDSGAANRYIYTGPAQRYAQASDGSHQWLTAVSGTAGNTISFTQVMTLDASGNLGIGTTSPSGNGRLELNVPSGNNTNLTFYENGASRWLIGSLTGSNAFRFYDLANGTERARIDSSGNLLVGTTNTTQSHIIVGKTAAAWNTQFLSSFATAGHNYGLNIAYTAAAPNGVGNQFLYCSDNASGGTLRAEIRSNGGIANYSANNVNLSDRREKTNFAPAKSYLDTICAIPVQTFNYIDQNLEDDPGLTLGVVAQDVQAVAPELVMESNWGTEDDPKMRLSIYQTDLQYALMKCIQEQQALIQQLQADVAALKGN